MLWQKLIGGDSGSSSLPLEFVGGAALSVASTSTPSFSLTGLTGGVGTAPSAGDIVFVAVSFVNSTDQNITCTTAGYTEIADLYAFGTTNAQMAVYYKVLGSAETSVAFNTVTTTVATRALIHVWRNPNATPLDATSTTATSTTSGVPNAASITTVTNNAVVIAFGVGSGSGFTALTVPSGMGNFFQNSSTAAGAAVASATVSTAGAYDPAAFGGGVASGTFCAVTVALRPQ